MQEKILEMLKQEKENGYVSGQELCERLGVSRTAVWKVIRQLKEAGYVIDSVPNRGYRLCESPDVLSHVEVAALLRTSWLGQKLYCLEETDSTNIQAKRLAEEGAPEGTLVIADMQSAGKGSRGRCWESPKGTGIFMSAVFRPKLLPVKASMITLVAAYSIASELRKTYGLDVKIKWPNDIVLNRKKIVGILTEMSSEMDFIHYIVIVIGINVNMESFPEELADKATSLYMESGTRFQRAKLAASFLNRMEKDYEQFAAQGSLAFLKDAYNEMLINRGETVRILQYQGEWCGIARGINENGELLVEKPDGTIREVFSGEVSVRGLYSYV